MFLGVSYDPVSRSVVPAYRGATTAEKLRGGAKVSVPTPGRLAPRPAKGRAGGEWVEMWHMGHRSISSIL